MKAHRLKKIPNAKMAHIMASEIWSHWKTFQNSWWMSHYYLSLVLQMSLFIMGLWAVSCCCCCCCNTTSCHWECSHSALMRHSWHQRTSSWLAGKHSGTCLAVRETDISLGSWEEPRRGKYCIYIQQVDSKLTFGWCLHNAVVSVVFAACFPCIQNGQNKQFSGEPDITKMV